MMKTFFSTSTKAINRNKIAAEIWFVRHGETTGNRESILQGHCDYPLTDLGLRQCGDVGNGLTEHFWRRTSRIISN